MMKTLLLSVFLLFLQLSLTAQTVETYIISAHREMDRENYFTALEMFHSAYRLDTTRLDLIKTMADISRDYNLYNHAMKWYSLLCNKDSTYACSEGYYHLGMMQKNNGLYKQSIRSFEKFIRLSADTSWLDKAAKQLHSTKKALEILKDTHDVMLMRLDKNVNTPFSEFGAIPVSSNRIFFTSVQPLSQAEYSTLFPEFASIWHSVIYTSRLTLAGYTPSQALPQQINKRNTHNGSISRVPGKRAYYFVRCLGDLNNEENCSIYYIEMAGNRWRNSRKLPPNINLQGYSALHPTLVFHGNLRVLYFVSNRPGGYGGKDIWYSIIEGDSYGEPVNLGSIINTEGNEVTPGYNSETGTLFFSSDGHPGLGGLDIFSSKGGLNVWEKPVNLAIPFNSPGNDLYFLMSESDSSGYLTSNRPPNQEMEGSTCCGNIYYFEWLASSREEEETVLSDTITPETRIRTLLPLALYFHNDIPDPRSTDTLSKRNYRETLIEYLDMKEKYEEEYSRGLRGDAKTRAQLEIRGFFDNYVEKGYQNLERITEWLIEDLREGYSVTLTISGFASPLNTSQYNYNLSKRRISSFVNYLYEFRSGILAPYLNNNAPNGAGLFIIQKPEGDAKALAFVSDNPNDKRNSIYSRSAAFERRIEIISYESTRSDLQALPKFELSTIDLGEVKKGEIKQRDVKILNTGNALARLQFVTPGCECISLEYTPDAIIPPGGYIEVKITFNPENQYPGAYHEILSAGFYGQDQYIMMTVAAFILE